MTPSPESAVWPHCASLHADASRRDDKPRQDGLTGMIPSIILWQQPEIASTTRWLNLLIVPTFAQGSAAARAKKYRRNVIAPVEPP
jgi:hypothetical protein